MSKEVKLDNGKTLIFEEGCFDEFEGTQEEMDEFKQTIIDLFSNMSDEELDKNSIPYTEEIDEPQKRS